jgi:predicted AlkP superfamily phosphohydrolase/phosphomutase
MVDARSRAVLYLMRTRPWDVLLAVFTATDVLQHFFWPDEHAPVEGDEWAPLRTVYRQIDSFLDDATKLIDENTTILVVSDHGFGPAHPARQCLNQLFEQLGLLSYHESRKRPRGLWLRNLLSYGRQLAPYQIQMRLARALPRLHGRALHESRYSRIDWSQTVAYAGRYGSKIRVNLEGREAEGVVSAEEYDSTRESVRDILLNLTNPATGRRVVQAVHCSEDVYQGPYAAKAADLLVEWQDEAVGDALCYSVDGEPIIVRTPEDSSARRVTGGHGPKGIVIGWGPGIRRGETVEGARTYDIAPTILYLENQPIPSDMDGDVLTGIFTDEQLERQPVRYSEPAEAAV